MILALPHMHKLEQTYEAPDIHASVQRYSGFFLKIR